MSDHPTNLFVWSDKWAPMRTIEQRPCLVPGKIVLSNEIEHPSHILRHNFCAVLGSLGNFFTKFDWSNVR